MNLLLILSAILSALTGTGLGGRGAEQPAIVAERIVGEVKAASPIASTARPVVLTSIVDVLGRWVGVAPAPRPDGPLYLARLRR